MRIGHGFDAHRFGEGDSVTIGGIAIPHSQRLIAHSDGDVLIHAICDAILGAMALGDIGKHFPDNDPAFKNIDSAELLKSVMQSANDKGYVVGNLGLHSDCTGTASWCIYSCDAIEALWTNQCRSRCSQCQSNDH